MTADTPAPAIAQLGGRLREARLEARLTVREAAEQIGLHGHGTLVQYENGTVLPPLDRLAALAHIYNVPLASLVVSDTALIPVVTLLEQASAPQINAISQLLEQVLAHAAADEQTP